MTSNKRPLDVIILAAGQGTRMKSSRPKVLHEVAGRAMVAWAVRAARELEARQVVVVTGHGADQVEAALHESGVTFAKQEKQRGTADAFLCGTAALQQHDGDILVLYGDTPLLRAETLKAMRDDHNTREQAMTVLTAELPDATGYGRILRDENNPEHVTGIVEQKDANDSQRKITEFNSGVYLFDNRAPELAARIENNNAAGEYYLTDILSLYRAADKKVGAYKIDNHEEVLGANDRAGLAQLEAIVRRRIREYHYKNGVSIPFPETVFIEDTVIIEPDVLIEAGVILNGNTTIGKGSRIGAYSVIGYSKLGEGVIIQPHSVIEGASIDKGSRVGPFARLREGSELGEHVHIGNFVEIKASTLENGVKAGHLAYLGDITIGQETNVGAGTIIANFDGMNKHRSHIGAGSFIGSNSTIISPRILGKGSFVAAGSTLSNDVPEGALAVARGQQKNIEHWSLRYWSQFGEKLDKKLPYLADWLKENKQS